MTPDDDRSDLPQARLEHLRFLDAYYSKVQWAYDATRRYYLFGRDTVLREIAAREPGFVIEVGCGTGRNLARLKKRLPDCRLGGVEPCRSMREYALRKHPWLTISSAFAEDADLPALLSAKPDIILLSYALSMMRTPEQALRNCVGALAPGGRVYVVDFGAGSGLGAIGRRLFTAWLHAFHVYPEALDPLFDQATARVEGPLGYCRQGVFQAADASVGLTNGRGPGGG